MLDMVPVTLFLLFFNSVFIHASEEQQNFEDLDLDRQVRLLNKPYVKSIQTGDDDTGDGDTFDCVNVYEQPAFDHPLLKNQKIQMKPSFSPKEFTSNSSTSVKLLEIGCPYGTVPIKRTSKGDIIRARTFMNYYHTANVYTTAAEGYPSFHTAVRILPLDPNRKYLGAGAKINVQNPSASEKQFSEAFVRLQSGPFDQVNSIQAGWMVNPALFGDGHTRLFTSWTSNKGGCVNLLCPGFVQVNNSFPLGSPLKDVSVYGGQQFDLGLSVVKDQQTGNWWLAYGDNYEWIIGYWPSTLFTSMKDFATVITWGGAAFGDEGTTPPMGSGHFAEEGQKKAAYIRDHQIIDDSHYKGPPDPDSLRFAADSPKCYNTGIISGDPHGFFYGGPGGIC